MPTPSKASKYFLIAGHDNTQLACFYCDTNIEVMLVKAEADSMHLVWQVWETDFVKMGSGYIYTLLDTSNTRDKREITKLAH